MMGLRLLTLSLMTVFAIQAQAQLRLANPQNSRRGTAPLDLLVAGTAASSEQFKDSLVQEALSDTDTKLTWPPLPRAWVEYANTEYIHSNTGVGLKFSPELFGLTATVATKMVFDFRYQLKSSFVMIASRDQSNTELFRFEEMRTYPNTTSARPLVGICIFESQFSFDKSGHFNFEILGSGETLNKGSIDSITNTHFSQFFQIDPNTSVDQYQYLCQTTYREKIQEQVVSDFSQQIINFVFHNHPQSQCEPDLKAQPNSNDSSCEAWMNKNYGPKMKDKAYARCEMQKGGAHRCTLRAKEGQSCNLYWNKKTGLSDIKGDWKDRLVTKAAMGCDEASKLSCAVVRPPWMMGPLALRNAKAQCLPTR